MTSRAAATERRADPMPPPAQPHNPRGRDPRGHLPGCSLERDGPGCGQAEQGVGAAADGRPRQRRRAAVRHNDGTSAHSTPCSPSADARRALRRPTACCAVSVCTTQMWTRTPPPRRIRSRSRWECVLARAHPPQHALSTCVSGHSPAVLQGNNPAVEDVELLNSYNGINVRRPHFAASPRPPSILPRRRRRRRHATTSRGCKVSRPTSGCTWTRRTTLGASRTCTSTPGCVRSVPPPALSPRPPGLRGR